jgi:hypothetical protein
MCVLLTLAFFSLKSKPLGGGAGRLYDPCLLLPITPIAAAAGTTVGVNMLDQRGDSSGVPNREQSCLATSGLVSIPHISSQAIEELTFNE